MVEKISDYLLNRSNFMALDRESLSVIELVGKAAAKTNEVVEDLNSKVSQTGDFQGTWFGKTPVESDPGIQGVVNDLSVRMDQLDNADLYGIPKTIYKLINKLPLTGVCVGDSITKGSVAGGDGSQVVANPYPAELSNLLKNLYGYSNVTIITKGYPGYRSDQVLGIFDANVIAANPDFCVILAGTNDVLQATSTELMKANIISMIDKCKAASVEVILLTLPPIGNPSFKDKVAGYNSVIKDVAKQKKVMLVDLNADLETAISNSLDTYDGMLPDYVHFADAKYKYIADVLTGRAFYPNAIIAEKEICVPAVNSKYVQTDCTELNTTTSQRYLKNLMYRMPGTGQPSGTTLRFVVYNLLRDGNIYCLGARTVNGAQVKPTVNGVVQANDVNFYDPTTTWDNEIPILANAGFGLKIVDLNKVNGSVPAGSTGYDLYPSGFGVKSLTGGWNTYENANLLNGWTHSDPLTYNKVGYRKDSGVVFLRGVISGGTKTANTTLFKLPKEYCPAKSVIVPAAVEKNGSINTCTLLIKSDGSVTIFEFAGVNWLSLDGICFSL